MSFQFLDPPGFIRYLRAPIDRCASPHTSGTRFRFIIRAPSTVPVKNGGAGGRKIRCSGPTSLAPPLLMSGQGRCPWFFRVPDVGLSFPAQIRKCGPVTRFGIGGSPVQRRVAWTTNVRNRGPVGWDRRTSSLWVATSYPWTWSRGCSLTLQCRPVCGRMGGMNLARHIHRSQPMVTASLSRCLIAVLPKCKINH